MSRTVHPVDFTRGGCVAADPRESAVSHFGAIWTRDMFKINELLIKYRTARAGSGAPHRAYMCSENGHCTSDTKHTALLRAILLIR